MSADKHPADVLADRRRIEGPLASWQREAEVMLRRIPGLETELAQLRAEVEALRADKDRIDWLADPENAIGNVQLPREVVEANLHSLRDAIDAARKAAP